MGDVLNVVGGVMNGVAKREAFEAFEELSTSFSETFFFLAGEDVSLE